MYGIIFLAAYELRPTATIPCELRPGYFLGLY